MEEEYHIYTDGSYKEGRTGAAIVVTNDYGKKIHARNKSFFQPESNPLTAEWSAIEMALDFIIENNIQLCTLFTDNIDVLNALQKTGKSIEAKGVIQCQRLENLKDRQINIGFIQGKRNKADKLSKK